MGRYPPHLLTFKGYRPSIFIVKICAVKKLVWGGKNHNQISYYLSDIFKLKIA